MTVLELSGWGEKAPYHVGEGVLADLPELARPHLAGRQAFVITDANVGPLYGSEIAERLAARLPQVGGVFMQMEDELGSIASVIGASWSGMKTS